MPTANMENYIKVIYDKKLRPYTKYPAQLAAYLMDRFAISRNSRLLDVGCGRGDMLNAFKQSGLHVNGLELLDYNAELIAGIEVAYANFENQSFPFPDDTFDVVFSKSVVEHLHNPENFLRESRRILKPGGRIITLTPDWQTQRYIFYNDFTHHQPYTVLGLSNALNVYDFTGVNTEIFYQLPIVWKVPFLKTMLKPLQFFFPVKKVTKSGFWRWSRELMILGTGVKD